MHGENTNSFESSNETLAVMKICHDCDLIQEIPLLIEGQTARCIRCDSILEKHRINSLNRSLALAMTGVILFILSNLFPLLSLKAGGLALDSTLFSTSVELFLIGRPFLSILVFFTTIIFPALSLMGMVYVLGSVKLGYVSHRIGPVFRFLRSTEVWGMLEVFLLAIIVAGVKLGDLAEVIPGISLYSFFALIVILALLSSTLDPDDVWHHQGKPHES
ncbi:MAG: paraquat-inducible protein A [Thiotrichaceae bacterium]